MKQFNTSFISAIAAAEPEDNAHTFPASVYQSGDFDVLDKTAVLHQSWQMAAHCTLPLARASSWPREAKASQSSCLALASALANTLPNKKQRLRSSRKPWKLCKFPTTVPNQAHYGGLTSELKSLVSESRETSLA